METTVHSEINAFIHVALRFPGALSGLAQVSCGCSGVRGSSGPPRVAPVRGRGATKRPLDLLLRAGRCLQSQNESLSIISPVLKGICND